MYCTGAGYQGVQTHQILRKTFNFLRQVTPSCPLSLPIMASLATTSKFRSLLASAGWHMHETKGKVDGGAVGVRE